MHRIVALVAALSALTVAAMPAVAAGSAQTPEFPRELPNLVPEPPSFGNVSVGPEDPPDVASDPEWYVENIVDRSPRRDAIRFHTTFVNEGDFSLELVGVPSGVSPETGTPQMQARQCVSWEGPEVSGAQRTCVAYDEVGTMTWDPHHFHVHLDNFMRYELRRPGPDGHPDWSDAGLVASGRKIGFCMTDAGATERAQVPAPWPIAMPAWQWTFLTRRWYVGCMTPGLPSFSNRMGVSPGWTDTYFSSYAGQQIVVGDEHTEVVVPDGEYHVVHRMNPDGAFAETSLEDNLAWTLIRLGTGPDGHRTVTRL